MRNGRTRSGLTMRGGFGHQVNHDNRTVLGEHLDESLFRGVLRQVAHKDGTTVGISLERWVQGAPTIGIAPGRTHDRSHVFDRGTEAKVRGSGWLLQAVRSILAEGLRSSDQHRILCAESTGGTYTLSITTILEVSELRPDTLRQLVHLALGLGRPPDAFDGPKGVKHTACLDLGDLSSSET